MSKDNIDKLRESFFEGTISPKDEKWLKEHSDDPYFKATKLEQEEKLDWSFEQFMATAETTLKDQKKGPFLYRNFYWSAAAMILVLFGAYLFFLNNKTLVQQQAKHRPTPTQKKEIPVAKEERKLPEEKATPNVIQSPVKKNLKKKKTILPPEDPQYNPEYVVINGKPIYDLEEAKELTKNSLNLLASTVEKSVSTMENVKHMSINF